MIEFVFSYTVITLVSLLSTIFIVLLNINQAKMNIHHIDFKTIVIELITMTIWVMMFIQFIRSDSPRESLLNLILLIFSFAFGTLLIKNIIKESTIRKNITNLKKRQEEVNGRLKELDKEKTDFISLVSHQLRGPLSSIQGYSSMILEEEFGKVPKRLSDPINKIFESSRIMGSLVNDFLDVTRIEKNELDYKIKPFDLVKILDSVSEDFSLLFEQNKVELIKTYNKNDDVIVIADSIRIKQVLSKLLDNALKYTPVGSVTLSLAIKDNDAIITISDTGIGITQDEIRDLFKKFKRGSTASSTSVHGSGLGLYVAKEIIESQGGKIWVESQGVGKGSKFYVAISISQE